jgi:D-alanine-D-alanine ligase
VVVKPVSEGSTLGVTIARTPREFSAGLKTAFQYGSSALVEDYIEGRELTVGVLNDRPLPVVEIVPPHGFYDFAAKYTPGATVYKAPAPLPASLAKRIQRLALDAHRRLGCRGATRVDFRLDRRSRPFVLEINTVPGLTETSLLPMAAKAARLSYEALVEAMLLSAVERESGSRKKGGRA